MTKRTAEWHLVGRDSDPVPADSYDVEQVASAFSDRGAVMDEAASTLQSLADLEGWTGEAAVKFADKADEAHGDLNKAGEKYTDAGSALSTFAGKVDDARRDTWTAVQAAETADKDRRANEGSLLDGVDDPSDELKKDEDDRVTALGNANSALDQARKDLDEAMSVLGTEAGNCASRINKASEKFKDSRMDNIKGFVAAAVDVLNVIAIIIVAIIIVILIVATAGGFLGVVLAAGGIISALMTIGTVVGAMILTLTLVQLAMGEADMGDVALATLGVIGGPLGKLGGRLAAPALARMTTAARASAALSARSSATYRLTARLAQSTRVNLFGLGNRFPLVSIREGLEAANADMVSDAIAGVDRTLGNLPQAGPLAQLAGLDGALDTMRNLNALRAMAGADNIASQLPRVYQGIGVQSIGGISTVAGQANDIGGFPDSLSNTIDNLQHLPDTFGIDAPSRPTQIVDVGR